MLRLGKYLLVDRINHGGMADIFLAKTFGYEGADRLMAVKCIRSDIASDANFVSMFIDEAKLAVQLDHVNIARTYDLGRIRDTYFIAMEYVPGRDVRGILDRANAMGNAMSYGIVLAIMDQMLEALDYAHRKADLTGVPLRIVHRDVSPHNVLISYSGEVKLIDFGIAKATTQGNSITGVLRGKYGYMSPEQVRGERVDLRSDIYATGVLLFELLTGQRLFTGASDLSILDKVRHSEVYPPSVIMTDVTRDLERVVLRALDPEPSKRFPSASDMRDAIVEVMLRRYGYRSQRDIGAYMAELFPQEIEAERSRIEKADSVQELPRDVEEYVGSSAHHARLEGTDTLPERPAEELSVTETEPEPGGARRVPSVEPPPALEDVGNNLVYGGPPPPAAVVSSDRYWSDASATDGEGETQVDFQLHEEQGSMTAVVRRKDRPDSERRPEPSAERDTEIKQDPRFPPPDDPAVTTLPDVPVKRGSPSATPPATAVLTQTTRIAKNPLPRERQIRDYLILGAAILVAAGIIVFTWSYTRVDPNAYGALAVESTPAGAKVLIDQVTLGYTPFRARRVRAGQREVVLELEGYAPKRRRVVISPNSTVEVNEVFER